MADNKNSKIKVKTPTTIANATRNKWIVIGVLAIAAMILVTMSMNSSQSVVRSKKKENLIDITPGSIDKHLTEKLQSSINTAQQKVEDLESKVGSQQSYSEKQKLQILELESKISQLQGKLKQQEEFSTVTEAKKNNKENDSYKLPPIERKDSVTSNTNFRKTTTVPPPPIPGVPYKANKFKTTMKNDVSSDAGTINGTIPPVGSTTEQPMVFKAKKTSTKNKNSEKNKTYKKNIYAGAIPPGAFADVALLSGLDAGASEYIRSNPQPIFMRVQNDAKLPGNANYRLKSCFVLGVGYGDTSAERAYIQATKITCVDTKLGGMVVAKLSGYLADSDGTLGLRGKVERRQGALLAKAMLAGFAEGASKILSAAQNTLVTSSQGVTSAFIDPQDLATAGAYAGMENSAKILAEQYIKEAQGMYPIVEIPAGRKATLMITDLVQLEWHPYNGKYIEDKKPDGAKS